MLSVIKQRLNEYDISTEIQQENALKEIIQEIILRDLYLTQSGNAINGYFIKSSTLATNLYPQVPYHSVYCYFF